MHLVDGGDKESTASNLLPIVDHNVITIRSGNLFKVPISLHGKGSIYSEGCLPSTWSLRPFVPLYILAPRNVALGKLRLDDKEACHNLFTAIDLALQTESKYRGFCQKRGIKHPLFGHCPKFPSTIMGPKSRRFSIGVSDDSYHVNYMDTTDLDKIGSFAGQLESVRDWCLPTHVIHDACGAVELSHCKTLGNTTSTTGLSLTAGNVKIGVHDDNDSTHSTVVILKKDYVCTPGDRVIAYFCFPRLGLAVPMRPGDVLVFNSREPHCLSSRSHESDSIYGMAIFMKAKVARGNNNGKPLTTVEICLAKKYEDSLS